MRELTLAVVGINHANANGSNRRFELLMCSPGEPVELRLEPKNEHDPLAVAVWSARGVQIGYLSAERCGLVGSRIRNAEGCVAIFQGLAEHVAYIRARFGGGNPTLPAAPAIDAEPGADPDSGFYPDPDGPEWGA